MRSQTDLPSTDHGHACWCYNWSQSKQTFWIQTEHLEKLCLRLVASCFDCPSVCLCHGHWLNSQRFQIPFSLALWHSAQRTWQSQLLDHCHSRSSTTLSLDGAQGIQLDYLVRHTSSQFWYSSVDTNDDTLSMDLTGDRKKKTFS